MTLGERLRAMLDDLPPGWSEASLLLTVPDAQRADDAAMLLTSLAPGRSGNTFRLRVVAPGGAGPTPDVTVRALDRLETEGIDARLSAAAAATMAPAPDREREPSRRPLLAEGWDDLRGQLPADWSTAYLELELDSSGDVEAAALRLAPVNPFLAEPEPHPRLRFRTARSFGYGAAPEMTRRTLARLDEAGIGGTLRVLRVHTDIRPVLTQGFVWRESGRAV